jgi:hypothetical protein
MNLSMTELATVPLVDAPPRSASLSRGGGKNISSIKYLERMNKSCITIREKSNQWGVEGYLAPNNDWAWLKPKTFHSKSKKENFIDV